MLEDPFGYQEKQQEKCYWRRVGFFAFAFIVMLGFFLLLLWPKKAHADNLVTKQGEDFVRLFNKPCKSAAILEQIRPEYQSRFQSGEASVSGKTYPMCWIASNGDVFMLYEDGDKGRVPMSIFEREL